MRACFNGEGPYYYSDPDVTPLSIKGKTWYPYRRPNGKIYAYVNKEDPDNCIYFYPMDKGDPIDNDPDQEIPNLGDDWQRYNRYKFEWQSDYYMTHYMVRKQISGRPTLVDRFVTIDNSAGNIELVSIEGEEGAAGRLTYQELIQENDPQRACSSQEEALYKNYQWFMTEKKMVIILPLKVDLDGTQAAIFQVLEANGVSGLGRLRKFRGNHYWAKSNADGKSTMPGDYRIEVVSSSSSEDSPINDYNVYYETLDCGHATPSVVGENLPAIARLAFPRYTTEKNRTVDHKDADLGSKEFQVGDSIWEERSALLAPFIAFVAALREHTPQENYGDNPLKRGIRMFVEGTSPLLKPLIYYQKGEGQHPHHTWKPRVLGATKAGPSSDWNDYQGDDFLRSSADFHNEAYKNASAWDGTDAERRYYQPAPVKNLLNILIDSDITVSNDPDTNFTQTRMDGILPLMMDNKSITCLIKALLKTNDFEAPDSTLIYGALEQITGTLRLTKGRFTEINENPVKQLYFPEFLFVSPDEKGIYGEYTSFKGQQREEDIILDIGLDRLIGQPAIDETSDGYGLVQYVDEQREEATRWKDFDDTLDLIEDLLYPTSQYSLVESILSLSEKAFGRERRYAEEEIKGLTYALGKLITHYDTNEDAWVNQGEAGFDDVLTILQVRLPDIHELLKDNDGFSGDNYKAALTILADMMKPDGSAEFLVKTMETHVDWETLLSDSARFLKDDLITEDDPLWSTLSALLEDLSKAVAASRDGSLMDDVYEKYGFQKND
ncbi:MAG: hypothetical protein KJ737_15520 [Proteobacteria bacterium]|nr:hypothetical protein [Pseudomonadota bacterium]